MDTAEFEQLLVDLREGRVHVRIGLEEPHASSDPAVASSLARQRAERIARGDRVAYVYKSPEDSDDDYSIGAAIDAEQARMLLAAGAAELGAKKSSPPLTDDDSARPQPVPSTVQPPMHARPAQTEEFPGTTDAKAPADQRQGAAASSLGGSSIIATGTVQGGAAGIDYLVLAPLAIERSALLDQVQSLNAEMRLDLERDEHHVALDDRGGGRIHIVIKSLERAGRVAAAIATQEALARLKPRAMMAVGVAGGIEGRTALGDVLVADQIIDASHRRASDTGDRVQSQVYRVSRPLLAIARDLDRAWVGRIATRPPGGVPSAPAVHFGPLVSTDTVEPSVRIPDRRCLRAARRRDQPEGPLVAAAPPVATGRCVATAGDRCRARVRRTQRPSARLPARTRIGIARKPSWGTARVCREKLLPLTTFAAAGKR